MSIFFGSGTDKSCGGSTYSGASDFGLSAAEELELNKLISRTNSALSSAEITAAQNQSRLDSCGQSLENVERIIKGNAETQQTLNNIANLADRTIQRARQAVYETRMAFWASLSALTFSLLRVVSSTYSIPKGSQPQVKAPTSSTDSTSLSQRIRCGFGDSDDGRMAGEPESRVEQNSNDHYDSARDHFGDYGQNVIEGANHLGHGDWGDSALKFGDAAAEGAKAISEAAKGAIGDFKNLDHDLFGAPANDFSLDHDMFGVTNE